MLRRLVTLVLAAAVLLSVVPPQAVEAASFGGNAHRGYFFNQFDDWGDNVISSGIWPNYHPLSSTGKPFVEDFIYEITTRLHGTHAQNRTGAEFLILTMLGYPRGTSKSVAHQTPVLSLWQATVRHYADNNWVQWYVDLSYTVNTYWQGNGAGSNPNDVAWYNNSGFENNGGIIFHRPGGSFYRIRMECANPVGDFSGLDDPTYQLTGSLQPGTLTPAFGGVVQAGGTYRLTPSVRNPSRINSNATTLLIGNLSPEYVNNAGMFSPGGWDGPFDYLVDGPGCANRATECWKWRYWTSPYLPPGVTSTHADGAVFTVSPTTPDGTSICFNYTITPGNTAGTNINQGPHCFTVQSPHYPQVIGTSGDVHAGGNLCGDEESPRNTGHITGHNLSQSLGEYVVSANGTVNNFGSNNTAGGTSATLGRTGTYYAVCRPNLWQTAKDYFDAGLTATSLPAGSYNLASLPPSANGVYFHNGGTLTLSGTFDRKITIVSLTGNVVIAGNIVLNAPATSGANAPSLGIIAGGDITINGAATRMDAYLFSNGTITTCTEGNAAACRNTLTVNGFLMAHELKFRRLGPSSGPSVTVGERINLTGQLYLNPPKFFDGASGINLLQNQGEKPPLN